MPQQGERHRGGAARYRTIRVGKGRGKRYMHIAIVRKAGPRGGRTVAGPVRTAKNT